MESSLEAIEALVLATVPSDAPDRCEAAAGRRAGRNEARRSVARLAGTIPDRATRRVSLRGGDARPIGNVGSAGRPVEFGYYKAQVVVEVAGTFRPHAASVPRSAPRSSLPRLSE